MRLIVTYHDGSGVQTDFRLSRITCSKIETKGSDVVDMAVLEDAEVLRKALLPFFARHELSGVWLFATLQSFIESGAARSRFEYDSGESLLFTRTDH